MTVPAFPPAPLTGQAASLGLYLSVPFCRSKCSFCNFASDVFAPHLKNEYVPLLMDELALAARQDGLSGIRVDSIYWGGGTPSLLDSAHLRSLLATIHANFDVAPDVEHTLEAAPGTLSDAALETWMELSINRVSLGVQSFIDQEVRAVGRLHTTAIVEQDFARLRRHGLTNFGADLIAGLPHQTAASWRISWQRLLELQVPHASVYMLEVDEDSRLGAELLAAGERYHATAVPMEDQVADFYLDACEGLNRAGLLQYEISNFARVGRQSRHNLRYWQRLPYLGVGVDAHSFLMDAHTGSQRRWGNVEDLSSYLEQRRAGLLPRLPAHALSPREVWEETLFLGLRTQMGIRLPALAAEFGSAVADATRTLFQECRDAGWLEQFAPESWRLTAQGRLLSNEVFTRVLDLPLPVLDPISAHR